MLSPLPPPAGRGGATVAADNINKSNVSICDALRRRKSLSSEQQGGGLGRVLGFADLTALGVGSTLGVGVFVLAGHVARDVAGPSVVLSFAVAALASLLAGVCYAEFGGREPRSGSAYAYAYVCSGELAAFVIGWNLVLEYVIGSASVARGLSLYLDSMLDGALGAAFRSVAPLAGGSGYYLAGHFDFLAFAIALLLALALAFGMKKSAVVNNLLSLLNVAVVAFVIIAGGVNIDVSNWSISPSTVTTSPSAGAGPIGAGGFFPFGVSGTLRGAANCFYGFVGFDCIASTGEEVREPRSTIPRAILASLLIIFLSYFGVSAVLTLMLPYYEQNRDAPLPYAFEQIGWSWAKWIVAIGGLFGLVTSLFGAMFPLPRILYAMATDGLIFRSLGLVSSRFNTPVVGTLLAGLLTGLMGALFDLHQLVNMMSIGTLMAYTMVAACVLLLRYEMVSSSSVIDTPTPPPSTDCTVDAELNRAAAHQHDQERSVLVNGGGGDGGDNIPPSLAEALAQLVRPAGCRRHCSTSSTPSSPDKPTELSAFVVRCLVGVYGALCVALALCLVYAESALVDGQPWAIAVCALLAALLLLALAAMALQPAAEKPTTFSVPFVPLVPGLSIFFNVYLMLMLDGVTWIRFVIWMFIGVAGWLASRILAAIRTRTNHPAAAWFSAKLPAGTLRRPDPMPNVVLPHQINYAYENCVELETSDELKTTTAAAATSSGPGAGTTSVDVGGTPVAAVVGGLPDVVQIINDRDAASSETEETSFRSNEDDNHQEELDQEEEPEEEVQVLAYLDDVLDMQEAEQPVAPPPPPPENQRFVRAIPCYPEGPVFGMSLKYGCRDIRFVTDEEEYDKHQFNIPSLIFGRKQMTTKFTDDDDDEKKDLEESMSEDTSGPVSMTVEDLKTASPEKDPTDAELVVSDGFVSVRNSAIARRLERLLSGHGVESNRNGSGDGEDCGGDGDGEDGRKKEETESMPTPRLDFERFRSLTTPAARAIPAPPPPPPPEPRSTSGGGDAPNLRRMHSTPAHANRKRKTSVMDVFPKDAAPTGSGNDRTLTNGVERTTNHDDNNGGGGGNGETTTTPEMRKMRGRDPETIKKAVTTTTTKGGGLVTIAPYGDKSNTEDVIKSGKNGGQDEDVSARREFRMKLNSILATRLSVNDASSAGGDGQGGGACDGGDGPQEGSETKSDS